MNSESDYEKITRLEKENQDLLNMLILANEIIKEYQKEREKDNLGHHFR